MGGRGGRRGRERDEDDWDGASRNLPSEDEASDEDFAIGEDGRRGNCLRCVASRCKIILRVM